MDVRVTTMGTQGLVSSGLGYGSMGTAVGYGPTDDEESIAAIRRARDLGVTMFDTAEMYGWGSGEELLGRAVAPFRDEVLIATKFGMTPEFGVDSRPEHIREVVEASLRRLGVDHIDILYQHRLDPKIAIDEVVAVMAEFVEAGTVRYLGLSEATPEALRSANAVHPISVLQTEYSLFARDAEALFPVLEELEIGFVAYAPLARGFLAGAAKPARSYSAGDFRTFMQWWDAVHFETNAALVEQLSEVARKREMTLAQLALAWIVSRGEHIVAIPGSRNAERVAENIASADLTLTPDDLDRINGIIPDGASGDRGTASPWL